MTFVKNQKTAMNVKHYTINSFQRKWFFRHLPLVLICLIAGCGDGNPARSPVAGTVAYNGETLNIGSLVFVPIAGGPAAQGEVGPNGKYVMGTYSTSDGVIPGEYKVMITALTSPGGSGLAEDSINGNSGPVSVIPDWYGDLEKSGLKAVVETGKANSIDFILNDNKP